MSDDTTNAFKAHVPKPMVYLGDDYTHIAISQNEIRGAIDAAMWLTASPHEWSWTHEQQIMMAKYCLVAHQRLSIMGYVAQAADIAHKPKRGNSDGE